MASRELLAQEGALVARASSGDRGAMGELYNRYFDTVYDFVFRMIRDADETADVVQDVFLRAISAIGSLKEGERFRSWLFSIAHNTTLNRLERQKRIVGPPADEEGEEPRIYQQVDPDRLADPQAALVDQETAALVWKAAAGLDRRQYALLDLHVRQGLDSAEIAQVMGVSIGNAYTMVSRLKSAVEESITAYLMARRGQKGCPVLSDILADQEIGGMTPELRRLVSLHVSDCPTCRENKKRIVSPVAILGAFAAVPPPFGLKETIFQNISGLSGGPAPGAGGAGSVSGREQRLTAREPLAAPMANAGREAIGTVLRMARAGREAIQDLPRMARASREAIAEVPRSRLYLLAAGGAMGIGGAVILTLLALFGAFSGDGDSAVLGAPSSPTPTALAAPAAAQPSPTASDAAAAMIATAAAAGSAGRTPTPTTPPTPTPPPPPAPTIPPAAPPAASQGAELTPTPTPPPPPAPTPTSTIPPTPTPTATPTATPTVPPAATPTVPPAATPTQPPAATPTVSPTPTPTTPPATPTPTAMKPVP